MKAGGFLLSLTLLSTIATAQNLECAFDGYKPIEGLRAAMNRGMLEINWEGEAGQQLRALFTIQDGHPVVQQLAAARAHGGWDVLGKDLTPEFQVTTGRRRISLTQRKLLQRFGIDTPAEEDVRKWNTFWDAPLVIPGGHDTTDVPRKASEIQRGSSTYQSRSCRVSTDGYRVSVTFDGMTLGLFTGDVEFTAYKGSNLLRQEAIAKTEEPSVAYIYKAGLKGFAIEDDTKLVWRDTARQWQQYEFGGASNNEPVNLRARNRLEILDTGRGSLAIFPPPHKFFFARENEVNLGYVYYRKDDDKTFSLGVMQPEKGEGYSPWGVSDAEWKRRTNTSREETENFALYNAPPGTVQHMAVYYYLSAKDARATQQEVLAYTHDDVFKPMPGFKVLTGHYHMDFNEKLRDRNTLDYQPSWVPVFRGLGINIVYFGDFHDDSDPNDPGPSDSRKKKSISKARAECPTKTFWSFPPKSRTPIWVATGT